MRRTTQRSCLLLAATISISTNLLAEKTKIDTGLFTQTGGNLSAPQLGAAYSLDGNLGIENIAERNSAAEQQLWISESGLTQNAVDLITAVGTLADEGLDPDAYYFQQLLKIHDSEPQSLKTEPANQLFERTFSKLLSDLGQGIVDPTKAQKHWYRPASSIDSQAIIKQVKQGLVSVEQALDSVRPQHWMYKGQVAMLKTLRKQQLSDQLFVDTGDKLQEGDEGQRVEQLRLALISTGDLEDGGSYSGQFDFELKNAVMALQERHGLEPDGVLGEGTAKALNTPIADRIAQVEQNLERWRWMPAQLEDTHILVNIPEYRLRMHNNGEQIFEMPVVVGKPKHMTPVFSQSMKHVVFAPTWTVPSSITNNELIPLEKKNPGYLAKEKIDFFRWTKNGGLKPIPRSRVTRDTLNQKPFPYMLRQRAGSDNALGKVKFLMPNKHNVYMHDTQAKKLFGKARRAYSHGCIRLANPDLMAYVVMQMEGYEQSKVAEYMDLKSTTRVDLKTHIPTHIGYFSSWQDETGKMHFREDVYGQDKRLSKALLAKKRSDLQFAKRTKVNTLVANNDQ